MFAQVVKEGAGIKENVDFYQFFSTTVTMSFCEERLITERSPENGS